MKPLIEALRDPEPRVRGAAANGLVGMAESHRNEEIRQKALYPALIALKDQNVDVRDAAACILRSFEHVEGLLMALADLDFGVVREFLAIWTYRIRFSQARFPREYEPEDAVILGSEILALIAREAYLHTNL